ncbi:uncharacterized protein HMPREF1120_02633 [Exophiala dermatitidis NIH/UT8656]|uniref:Uncharacterized protein n=1 Tax=Exophiala dermatitidis (strain ATCC 34100 / CBS 525.76 / NIH/UT8656) TaxID=858893 RepID=H6BQ20_EXODN|nr:uncharacterized protein HMPREF1120_02633 [Exophiala dermatitidis NIH/UT8656]EHY54465.1 hypothetical protein HMPREF1120_02633 [Exophiala dermatitidis NIH/UT8656]
MSQVHPCSHSRSLAVDRVWPRIERRSIGKRRVGQSERREWLRGAPGWLDELRSGDGWRFHFSARAAALVLVLVLIGACRRLRWMKRTRGQAQAWGSVGGVTGFAYRWKKWRDMRELEATNSTLQVSENRPLAGRNAAGCHHFEPGPCNYTVNNIKKVRLLMLSHSVRLCDVSHCGQPALAKGESRTLGLSITGRSKKWDHECR